MAVGYFMLSATNSDLTGGYNFNKALTTAVESISYITVTVPKSSTQSSYAFTAANIPNNTAWESGTITIRVNMSGAGDANLYLSMKTARVSATGTLISSTYATPEFNTSGGGTFVWTGPSPSGSGAAATDRFRLEFIFRNASSSVSATVTLTAGSSTNVDTPITINDGSEIERLVSSAADLYNVRSFLNGTYRQTCDIDLSGYSWTPIGSESNGNTFSGKYDGGGFKITGLNVNSTAAPAGLFGVAEPAIESMYHTPTLAELPVLQNINIVDAHVVGDTNVGILCGASRGIIRNCHVSGTVIGCSQVGGFIGGFSEAGKYTESGHLSEITLCSSNANVSASGQYASSLGGFIGFCYIYSLQKCYAAGTVTMNSDPGFMAYVGGFAGVTSGEKNWSNCYSRVNVISTADDTAGGFIGWGSGTGQYIANCYSTGHVSGGTTRAFIGIFENGPPNVTSCYYDSSLTGCSDTYASGQSTGAMQTQGTFSGWDFSTIWGIAPNINNGYPYFIEMTYTETPVNPGYNVYVKDGGAWVQATGVYVKDSAAWKQGLSVQVKQTNWYN